MQVKVNKLKNESRIPKLVSIAGCSFLPDVGAGSIATIPVDAFSYGDSHQIPRNDFIGSFMSFLRAAHPISSCYNQFVQNRAVTAQRNLLTKFILLPLHDVYASISQGYRQYHCKRIPSRHLESGRLRNDPVNIVSAWPTPIPNPIKKG